MSNLTAPLTIDCLQYSKPARERFEEWRKGELSCVHVTLAIWENARETLNVIGAWNRLFADNADLVALATTAAEIEEIAARRAEDAEFSRTEIATELENVKRREHCRSEAAAEMLEREIETSTAPHRS